eukprot:m.331815 g.331815  ORF g.331815 m.331815 type:complete len:214 (+) comp20485_c0_seq1:1263-1904(+)
MPTLQSHSFPTIGAGTHPTTRMDLGHAAECLGDDASSSRWDETQVSVFEASTELRSTKTRYTAGAAQKRKRPPRQRPLRAMTSTSDLDTKLRSIFSAEDWVASTPEWKLLLKRAELSEKEAQRAQQMRRRALSRGYTFKSRQKDMRKQQTMREQLTTAERKIELMQREIEQLQAENIALRQCTPSAMSDEQFDTWLSAVPSPADDSSSSEALF